MKKAMIERISITWKTSISRVMIRPEIAISSSRLIDVSIQAAAFFVDGAGWADDVAREALAD
jgi:hypothetical protein